MKTPPVSLLSQAPRAAGTCRRPGRAAALLALLCPVLLLGACAGTAGGAVQAPESALRGGAVPDGFAALEAAALLDRLTWGATSADFAHIRAIGNAAWIEEQLRGGPAGGLPASVDEQIRTMSISTTPLPDLVYRLDAQRKAADAIKDDEAKKAAQQDYQRELNRLAREAAARSLLRDLYSPSQLQEQMTWFWGNRFNVHQHKHQIRALIGDYDEQLRAHALGRFRDLLAASAHHPAMLAYLDNAQNATKHINENYARELLELHTLGVDGGYTQRDVQELARVLTGFGVNQNDPAHSDPPKLRRELADQYRREGLFEFNPARHDYGDKQVLGHTIHGRGMAELDEVLDLLSRHPATARSVSRQLAHFLIGEDVPPALVDQMAQVFLQSDGDIARVLRIAFASEAFAASLHRQFKDPVHYVVSAVRVAYDTRPIVNAGPMVNWLNRLGEAPFNHPTPDGYPLGESSWSASGQMAVRFEIAKAIGSGSAGLFKSEGPNPAEKPAFPQLANALYYQSTQQRLAASTRQALEQANSPQEWNLLLLSSPEFMLR